ncbi:hypothetical protein DXA13_08515 [Clostridium sp. AM58-1XD]|nr:hypothetical protein DXA13_08515 [Clostridium sp. AM58-1XD]
MKSEMFLMQINKIQESQWLGAPENRKKPCRFRAGKITLEFLDGRILNIRAGGIRLIDEVYFALRDYNWGTIPYRMEGLQFEEKEDFFRISFKAIHDSGNIRFEWEGIITGNSESSVKYEFYGQADSDFLRNRIGLCVLHPAACGGMDCEVEHFSSAPEKGRFPELISPHQPFADMKSITHRPKKGMALKVAFQGDVFEMEDQRNWTDASFKTYCTPLSIPFPVQVHKGERISQSVEISLLEAENVDSEEVGEQEETIVSIREFPMMERRCSLGSCITRPLTRLQFERIAVLEMSHLRVDYHFIDGEEGDIQEIFCQAKDLGLNVLLAVFFTERWNDEILSLKRLLSDLEKQLLGLLIFQEGVTVMPGKRLECIRSELTEWNVPVGSGTDAFFTQINRQKPERDSMDFVSYSNNPQVHAFDNDSIMSTTEGQAANLRSCAALYPGLPVWVSPITLKMRWNPDATGREPVKKGELPKDVDPRQMSLFAASWFLRSAAACMAGGAAGMTYFELTGAKG